MFSQNREEFVALDANPAREHVDRIVRCTVIQNLRDKMSDCSIFHADDAPGSRAGSWLAHSFEFSTNALNVDHGIYTHGVP